MLKNNNQQVIKRMAKTSFFRNKGKNLVLVAEASSAEIAEEVCGRLDVARGIAIYDQLLPGKNKTPGAGRIKSRRAGRAAAGDRACR